MSSIDDTLAKRKRDREAIVRVEDIRKAEKQLAHDIQVSKLDPSILNPAKLERMRRKRAYLNARRRTLAIEKAYHFDTIVNEAIDLFARNQLAHGVQCVEELAEVWKIARQPRRSFIDLMAFIEHKAIKKSGDALLRTKISIALREHRAKKAGTVLVLLH